jgi:hypothetical protein
LWEDEGKNNGQRRVELGMRYRKLASGAQGGVIFFFLSFFFKKKKKLVKIYFQSIILWNEPNRTCFSCGHTAFLERSLERSLE